MRRSQLALFVAALLAAVATTVFVVAQATAGRERCAQARDASTQRAELVTGTGRDVLVIGDSYAVGLGVQPEKSWPTRLDGRVRVAGFSGSGFSRGASSCGDRSFATRARSAPHAKPSLIVVAGGLNDTDQPSAAVGAGFGRLMSTLAGHRVVVVGPAPAPARVTPETDQRLAALSAKHGVPYLSLADRQFDYLPDRLHLTVAGHQEFGDAVADWLAGVEVPVLKGQTVQR